MSRLESLVFLWPCRVYGGSCKTSLFPECVARVPVSLCGSAGVEGLLARRCVHGRNRPQPFVRSPYGRAYMVSSAEVVTFGGFQRFVASFRVAGVALGDIQTCFVTCRKSFCVARAILLRRFQKMRGSFRGRTLDVTSDHRHFSWQAQHFRRVV